MKFEVKTTLMVDQNPNGSYEKDLNQDETLLIGEHEVYSWDSDSDHYGYQSNWLYPAYYNGEKAWIHEWDFIAEGNCSAEGSGEKIIPFKEGVELLLSFGTYEHMFQKDE